jgi:hypothetical protein
MDSTASRKMPQSVEILLGERLPAHAVAGQRPEILQRLEHAFPAEDVQAPEQHQVELAARRGLHHGLELRPVAVLATRLVDVFVSYLPVRLRLPLGLVTLEHHLSLIALADQVGDGLDHHFRLCLTAKKRGQLG